MYCLLVFHGRSELSSHYLSGIFISCCTYLSPIFPSMPAVRPWDSSQKRYESIPAIPGCSWVTSNFMFRRRKEFLRVI